MSGPLTTAKLKNDFVTVPLALLNAPQLASIKAATTYKNSTIAYQLKNSRRWMKPAQIQELNNNLYVQLWKEVDGNLILPQGFAHVLPETLPIQDERVLPSLKKMIWFKKPKHEARYYQKEAIAALQATTRGQAVMATGCHAKGQLILMFDGKLKKVEHVAVGDLIMGPDSLSRTVLRLCRGQDQMYKITPTKGESFVVNGEHILSLVSSEKVQQRPSRPKYLNITVNNYLKLSKSYKHLYKLYRASINFSAESELEIDPYILGTWLGDGNSRATEICSMDEEIVEAWSSYCKVVGLDFYKRQQCGKAAAYNVRGFTWRSNSFRAHLKKLNLLQNKHIPQHYKTASEASRLAMLAGILDTDGSLDSNCYDIILKSKTLFDDMVFVARSLGFGVTVTPSIRCCMNAKQPHRDLYWRACISGNIEHIPCKLLRKQASPRQQIKNVLHTGFTVEKLNVDDYYGFQVDKDNLYVMGDFTVTHNSGKSLTMLNLVREMGLRTLIVCPSSIIGDQLYQDFADHLGKKVVGMYGSGKKEIKQVTIGLYQSVTRNIEAFKDIQLVVCDENQTLGAGSLVAITRQLGHAPYFYSLSATNYRADGRTPEIYAASGPVVYNFDTLRAISEKWLAQPYFFVRDVTSCGRNYDLKQKNYTEHVVQNGPLNDQIVKDVTNMLQAGKSTLILVQEIEHGEAIAQRVGLPFANGENKDSMKLIKALNRGEIKGLVAGAQMCSVGVDTVRVDCLINAAFQGSEGIVTQSLGRGLRKYDGKTKVVILDYIPIGNEMLKRHGEFRCKVYEKYGPVKRIAADVSN